MVFTTHFAWIFVSIVTVNSLGVLLSPSVHGLEVKFTEPASGDAFATIGGDGYVPMYLRRIAPSLLATDTHLYCAFQNSLGRPVVMSLDLASAEWSPATTASQHGMPKDMHGSPAMTVDAEGYFHLFFGCHNDPMQHVRSAKPWSIDAWQSAPIPAKNASYPEVIRQADGKLLLFFRAGGHPEPWVQLSSLDDGRSWSPAEKLIEMRLDPARPKAAAYARFFPGFNGDTVHCVFNYKEDNPDRYPAAWNTLSKPIYRFNLYYMVCGSDGVWRNAAGDRLALPLTRTSADNACKLYDSGDLFAYPGAYAVDRADRPYFVFRVGVLPWDKGGPDQMFRASVDELNRNASPVVPLQERYVTRRDGEWVIRDELPSSWSQQVQLLLTGPGEAAVRITNTRGIVQDNRPPAFLFFRRNPEPTSLYLFRMDAGYMRSASGPLTLP